MTEMRKLPVGIQSFEVLRQDNYLYVDKTKYIWDLVQTGRVYFLSRPRRFGKSLLISTLEAYFEGKRELFDGLAIQALEDAKGDDAWQAYPVIRFSLSSGDYHARDGLADALNKVLEGCIAAYDLTGPYAVGGETLPVRFANVIAKLCAKTGRRVVVLVDEYDKPLLETMVSDEEQEERNRRLYKGFFSALKDQDEYLKFVFFTGVTKFSKVSVFSDLNQLRDISLSEDAAGVCGITESELLENFHPEIDAMAQAQKTDSAECVRRLAQMYDGYRFSPEGSGVYNPFSLLNAFQDRKLRRYWFETGTPEILVKKLESSRVTAENLADGVQVAESSLTDYRIENPDPLPLFYQSGYLTIKGFDDEFQLYTLGFPNDEVKYGFLDSLMPSVLGSDVEQPAALAQIVRGLRTGKLEPVMEQLESLFASIPYPEGTPHSYEQEWRNEVFLIFALMGLHAQCEVHTAKGRVDCVVQARGYVYVFEFKLDKPADEALAQIEEKGYAKPFEADSRKVTRVGVSFSSEERNIAEWKTA